MASELSTQRALAVQNFFINVGVDDRMLSSRGFGFDQPLVSDANSPDAHTNLRVVVVLQNLHQLDQVIQKIQQNHASWKPEQGFGICGSPDVRISMNTGELSHPTIEFKDHTAELLSECEPSVAAVARVLVYLESHAYHTGEREDLKKRFPSLCAPATPIEKEAVESELDKVTGLQANFPVGKLNLEGELNKLTQATIPAASTVSTVMNVSLSTNTPFGMQLDEFQRESGGSDYRIGTIKPGGQAAQKGVPEGHTIVALNGVSTRNMTYDQVIAKLKGQGMMTLKLQSPEEL